MPRFITIDINGTAIEIDKQLWRTLGPTRAIAIGAVITALKIRVNQGRDPFSGNKLIDELENQPLTERRNGNG